MRFDDRLETALAIDPSNAGGRAALWRQLLDTLAQVGNAMPATVAGRCLSILAVLRPQIPAAIRVSSVRALDGRLRYAPLVAFLANDVPGVVRQAMAGARLSDDGWIAILPDSSPLSRSFLRLRTDLSPAVRRALDSFGRHDMALPHPETAADEAATDTVVEAAAAPVASDDSDIARLVRRIDDYRARQPVAAAPAVVQLRTDAGGLVRAVAGIRAGRLVGLSIADAAEPGGIGPDAGVARAFAKRVPIRSGRLLIPAADGGVALWIVDADPEFDKATGRFSGFAGTVRPASADEAEPVATLPDAEAGPDAAPLADSMRQMVHELRSPLNAISGFAQLIEGQYFGPVVDRYRTMAQSIMADARRMTQSLEDIDLAARLDAGSIGLDGGIADCADAFAAAVAGLRQPGAEPLRLDWQVGDAPTGVAVAPESLSLLVTRVLRAVAAEAGAGAIIVTSGAPADAMVSLRIAAQRAASPVAVDDDALIAGSMALRLAGRLAELAGGDFSASDSTASGRQYILNLPRAKSGHRRIGGSG